MNFQINNSVNLSNIKPYNSGVNTIDYTYNKGTYTSNSNSQENPETEYLEIENIEALEVLDSRGNPTLLVKVKTSFGDMGKAIVPSRSFYWKI